ncbi:hypothetical protein L195_g062092 [Trifolium pratense]|uniref:Uncharacterized protein n=1 Tax=Trifolium pratense TaxID=57577 RepID=A0A2K3KDR6_TRIPR|nr:hypothetical protein L195_g062092 [Trifolium pratense]
MGELMLRTDDQQVTFNVFDKMECDDGDPHCFKIQVYDHIVKHALELPWNAHYLPHGGTSSP